MKYYLIAGEASGDLHASNLMKSILKEDANATFRFWGGELMEAVGGTLVTHYKKLAFMGFYEVLKNLTTLSKYIKQCKTDIKSYNPDVVLFVDYSGFNLRIAPFVKEIGIPTHFYIAPKVWAWNEKRVKKLKKYIDHLYVIFPFEKAYFEKKHDYNVHFVGNPLQDEILKRPVVDEKAFRKKHQLGEKPIIALLPGSRSQEINKMLPLMTKMEMEFPNYTFVVAGSPNREKTFYDSILKRDNYQFISNKTYDLLSISYAAIVTSGTATLETALFKIPQVVCYKTSSITYHIAKSLVLSELKYISLVNLVADKKIVSELIQHDFNAERLKLELSKILQTTYRTNIFENYLELENKLGHDGASNKVAQILINTLRTGSK